MHRGTATLVVLALAACVGAASLDFTVPQSIEEAVFTMQYDDEAAKYADSPDSFDDRGRFLVEDGPEHLLLFLDSKDESNSDHTRSAVRRIRRDTGEPVSLRSFGPASPSDISSTRAVVRYGSSLWIAIDDRGCTTWDQTSWPVSVTITRCLILLEYDPVHDQVLSEVGVEGIRTTAAALLEDPTAIDPPDLYVSADVYTDVSTDPGDAYVGLGDALIARIPIISRTPAEIAATTWMRHFGTAAEDTSRSVQTRIGDALFATIGYDDSCRLYRFDAATGDINGFIDADVGHTAVGSDDIYANGSIDVFEALVPEDSEQSMPASYVKSLRLAERGQLRSIVHHKKLDVLIVSYFFKQIAPTDPSLAPGNSHLGLAFIDVSSESLSIISNLVWDTGDTGESKVSHLMLTEDETQLYFAAEVVGSLPGSGKTSSLAAGVVRFDLADTLSDAPSDPSDNDLLIWVLGIAGSVLVLGSGAAIVMSRRRGSIERRDNPPVALRAPASPVKPATVSPVKPAASPVKPASPAKPAAGAVLVDPASAMPRTRRPVSIAKQGASSSVSRRRGKLKRSTSDPPPRRAKNRVSALSLPAPPDDQPVPYVTVPIGTLTSDDSSRRSMTSYVTVTSEAAPYFG